MSHDTMTADVPPKLRDRVDVMYRNDSIAAALMVFVLWCTILFVILAVRAYMPPAVEAACWIAAALLLAFNTASIITMIRHYGEDRKHIYEVDIRHLDAGR